MTKAETKKAPASVKIKLLRDHTHKRVPCKPGDVIDVLPHTADKLVGRKIGERV